MVALLSFVLTTTARTFDFSFLGFTGTKDGGNHFTTQTKRGYFRIKVGSALKTDCMDEMEIRAATIFRDQQTKRVAVNDIASFRFVPKNMGKAIYFEVATGIARSEVAGQDTYYGWQVAGCVVEIRQGGKVIKHWTGAKGVPSNMKLDNGVRQLRLSKNGHAIPENGDLDNATQIYCVDSSRKRMELEEVMAPFETDPPETGKVDRADKAKETGGEDFTLGKFCGYTFGAKKPDLTTKGRIRMQRPFRHYEFIRLTYGEYTQMLSTIRLESSQSFKNRNERETVQAAIAVIFEKRYGIRMKDNGDYGYAFDNAHISIRIQANAIEVHNRDIAKQDELRGKDLRDANKSKAAQKASSDDADIL